jgi:hypothetical protein
MLAFRRGATVLQTGITMFHDKPDPILMFDRTRDGSTLTCAFNLSPGVVNVAAKGTLTGLSQNADIGADGLALGPNGFAFLV